MIELRKDLFSPDLTQQLKNLHEKIEDHDDLKLSDVVRTFFENVFEAIFRN